MKNLEALQILGLEPECGASEVHAAFKRKTGQLTAPQADDVVENLYTIGELQHARRVLLNNTETENLPCQTCKGSGKVQLGFRMHTCAVCSGTGERK